MTPPSPPERPTERSDAPFDHRDPGNPPGAWRSRLATLPESSLPPGGTTIVVLAAHPDDETLGCGGILALASDRAFDIRVIIATDGEASHPYSTTYEPGQLTSWRRRESRAAVELLCPNAELIHLGLPDGKLTAHTDALCAAVDQAAGAGPAWILAPWEGDHHPDHAACARAARRATQAHPARSIAEFPVWLWHWADPRGRDLPARASRISCGANGNRRRQAALGAYRSQTHALSELPGDEAILQPQFTAHFDREFDVLIDPAASASDPAYFDMLFADSDDPWGIGAGWYEERKREVLLASLPRRQFDAAFEPGCAAGHLTKRLATRCGHLLAADIASRAVTLTAEATAGMANVSVRQMSLPQQWPDDQFDLIVLSEIGYYIDDVAEFARRLRPSLTANGVVAACHWRYPTIEHAHSAEFVHDTILRESELHRIAMHHEEDFLLDVFSVDGRSVARSHDVVH